MGGALGVPPIQRIYHLSHNPSAMSHRFDTNNVLPYADKYPDLLKCDQLELWKRLLGNSYRLGERFCNPFRHDSNAGCQLWMGNDGIIRLRDFASDMNGKDVFSLAAHVYFVHPLQAVYKLMESGSVMDVQAGTVFTRTSPWKPFLSWRRCNWRKGDALYWKMYNISRSALESSGTFAVDKVWMASRQSREIFSINTPGPSSITLIGRYAKLYRPSGDVRFYSTVPPGTIAGKPIDGNTLFITKFIKDCITLNRLGYPSVFSTSEADPVGEDFLFKALNSYREVIHLTDSDNAGMSSRDRLNSVYREMPNIEARSMPYVDDRCTDPSDVVRYFGDNDARNVLSSI